MRTTVTIDPDVEALLRAAMNEPGASFKKALNDGLRVGLQAGRTRPAAPYRLKTHRMRFRPELLLDKAIDLAGLPVGHEPASAQPIAISLGPRDCGG